MMFKNFLIKNSIITRYSIRYASSNSYKLVVVGGGTAGLNIASRFNRALGKNNVAIIEPSDMHYFQPMWTFVGAGLVDVKKSSCSMKDLIPSGCDWHQCKVEKFSPSDNLIQLSNNKTINYEYLVVATGIEMDLDKIKGLKEAFQTDNVCSNYMINTVTKTSKCFENFHGGNAIFTFPNTPIKCAGAPQKIMYLFDDHLRRNNKRQTANIMFNTALGVIFGVEKYAKALNELVKQRGLSVNFKHNLIEVKPETSEAVFEKLETGEKVSFKYDLMHVTPPQRPSKVLQPLADESGFVSVNRDTMQHTKYPNIFGLGDCSNAPTSRTAAAVAAQSKVVHKNLLAQMNSKSLDAKYSGYTSCPIITSNKTVIMAEFDYDGKPMETFPFNQAKERRTMYWMTKSIIPAIYWSLMTKGYWNGPAAYRKILHFGR